MKFKLRQWNRRIFVNKNSLQLKTNRRCVNRCISYKYAREGGAPSEQVNWCIWSHGTLYIRMRYVNIGELLMYKSTSEYKYIEYKNLKTFSVMATYMLSWLYKRSVSGI